MAQTAADGTAYEWHGDSGPVIALIHGAGLNRAMWQWQRAALMEKHRVLSYDLYGHGESPAPDSTPDLSMFSGQLLRLLDETGIRSCVVVGFSLGGMIGRRFAMDYPERLSALAILNSPHRRDEAAQEAILKRLDQVRRDGPAATVEAALERWFTDRFRAANPRTIELVRTWVLANDEQVYPAIYQVLANGVAELIAPTPALSCPTLVMTGDEDFGNPPAMSHAIAGEISGSRTVILSGLRHMALAEDPEQVNEVLLSFLDHVRRTADG
ncbi:MAG: alpha/beta fold hydrolase [Alphaproteobacteria bacterium]